jgi:predicted transcriptional regulator
MPPYKIGMENTAQRGRPRVGPQVAIRLPTDLLARIDAIAAERGRTRAEVIRRALSRVLSRREAAQVIDAVWRRGFAGQP